MSITWLMAAPMKKRMIHGLMISAFSLSIASLSSGFITGCSIMGFFAIQMKLLVNRLIIESALDSSLPPMIGLLGKSFRLAFCFLTD